MSFSVFMSFSLLQRNLKQYYAYLDIHHAHDYNTVLTLSKTAFPNLASQTNVTFTMNFNDMADAQRHAWCCVDPEVQVFYVSLSCIIERNKVQLKKIKRLAFEIMKQVQ